MKKEQTFLSTPSARRATGSAGVGRSIELISIHALREEGDLMRIPGRSLLFYFYPRPPRGGRQALLDVLQVFQRISIHALREEGDCSVSGPAKQAKNFYPRPPRGGRQRGR